MARYDEIYRWCKVHDKCLNRCKVINDVADGAVIVSCRAGRYKVEIFGRLLAEWYAYDLRSVEDGLVCLSAAFDVLWDARRLGLLLV